MSVIAWPSLEVASFRWKKVDQDVVFRSVFGSQGLRAGVSAWSVEMTGVPKYWDDARQIEVFLESFDGFANQLALHNLVHPLPSGTLRGAPVLQNNASAGAVVLKVFAGMTQIGATILRGDLLGIGTGMSQQVVRVFADSVVDDDGAIDIQIGMPLRNSFDSGAPLVWNRPKALFRQAAVNDGIEYLPVIGQPWTLSLVEDWRP